MSAHFERSSEGTAPALPATDDLSLSAPESEPEPQPARTLADLPLGARLVLRCRKDWRTAAVAAIFPDAVTLTVCSPSGHTYRVRRPPAAPLAFHGHIPILTDRDHACWRTALARYDARW